MNRYPTTSKFSFSVIILLFALLALVLIPRSFASSTSTQGFAENDSYIGREFSYSYMTRETATSYQTSKGTGVLVSIDDSLLIFSMMYPNQDAPSFKAIPVHRLISMSTTGN